VHLDSVVGCVEGGVGRVLLCNRDVARVPHALVLHPRDLKVEKAADLVVARHAGDHLLDELVAANLLAEGVPRDRVHITGNTGIDAVLYVRDALESGALPAAEWPWIDRGRRLIVVTGHRRENFGDRFLRVMRALGRIAGRPDVELVYPVHRNPNVLGPAHDLLGAHPNVHLLEPLAYVPFVDLMRRAYLLITDSGGIQEEAPSLGKPVLVLREKTERPEAVEAGTVKLVGTDEDRIVAEATRLLDDPVEYARMTRVHNPYGDGQASRRIAEVLTEFFKGS